VISPLAHLVPTAPSAHGGSKGRPADDERHHQNEQEVNNGINNPYRNITRKTSILTYLSRA